MPINVLEYLEATAGRVPAKPAVIDSEGALTFAELRRQARALGGTIALRAEAHRQPVAVFLPKSKDCIVAFAAILYSGGCYAPIDLKSPALRIAALLENLGPALVVTKRALEPSLRSIGFMGPVLCMEDVDSTFEADIPETIDTDPAYIMHTSGSTGVPKGVVISHRGVIDYIEWASTCYSVGEDDTIGNQAPFHFDNSTLDIYLCLSKGATLSSSRNRTSRFRQGWLSIFGTNP